MMFVGGSWRAMVNGDMLGEVIGTKALLHWKMREIAAAFNQWSFMALSMGEQCS